MPRKYVRRIRVTKATTVDGNTYTSGWVVINELPIPGFTFIRKTIKNQKSSVLWPRIYVGKKQNDGFPLRRIVPPKGLTGHVISAFEEYIKAHPWQGEEMEEDMTKEKINHQIERWIGDIRYQHQQHPELRFEEIARRLLCPIELVRFELQDKFGIRTHEYCDPKCPHSEAAKRQAAIEKTEAGRDREEFRRRQSANRDERDSRNSAFKAQLIERLHQEYQVGL